MPAPSSLPLLVLIPDMLSEQKVSFSRMAYILL